MSRINSGALSGVNPFHHSHSAPCKKQKAWKQLCEIPSIGPIRAAEMLGILQTPHRFRTKRQLWTYCGLAIETHSSADHRCVNSFNDPGRTSWFGASTETAITI